MQIAASEIRGKTKAIQTLDRSSRYIRRWSPALFHNGITDALGMASSILEANFRGPCPRSPVRNRETQTFWAVPAACVFYRLALGK